MPPNSPRSTRGRTTTAQIGVRLLSPVVLVGGIGLWGLHLPPATAPVWDAPREVNDVCIVLAPDGRLLARACVNPTQAMRRAPNVARLAAGLPACWWTLEAVDLAAVRGLGEARARAVVEARDWGVVLSVESLRREVAGVGPSLAARVVAHATTDCEP